MTKVMTTEQHRVMEGVLNRVRQERARQFNQYGSNDSLKDGTGLNTRWLAPLSWEPAGAVETRFRADYEEFEAETGNPTWVHLIREEVAEAFQETDDARLVAELTQVAALCVSWVEKILSRNEVGL